MKSIGYYLWHEDEFISGMTFAVIFAVSILVIALIIKIMG